jgi:uncharacterized membrane protein
MKKQKKHKTSSYKDVSGQSKRPEVESATRVAATARVGAIDAWRGAAIVLMIAYHFCFDLNYFHVIHQDMHHQLFWVSARSLIVTMFLTLVGISLVLSAHRQPGWRGFGMRQFRIGACAVLVSAGSYAMFPATFIYFGILHFIFFASFIGMALVRARVPAIALAAAGVLAIATALFWSDPWFDAAPWRWVGFMTHKPFTEDYVPMFPWIGVVLLGIALGKILLAKVLKPAAPGAVATRNPALRLGRLMGRHSLLIYMVHQPLLMGVLYVLVGR